MKRRLIPILAGFDPLYWLAAFGTDQGLPPQSDLTGTFVIAGTMTGTFTTTGTLTGTFTTTGTLTGSW